MRFKVPAAVLGMQGVQSNRRVCAADERLLGVMVRHGDTWRPAILVDTRLANEAFYLVTIRQGLAQGLEDHGSHTLLKCASISVSAWNE